MTKLQNKKILFFLIYVLIVITYSCSSIENEKNFIDGVKYGLYTNKEETEIIIIIDSINYVHQYKMNNTWYSDTAHYFYLSGKKDSTQKYYYSYSSSNENFKPIIFEEFFISDSSKYYMNIIQKNKVIDMLYYHNYNPQIIGGIPVPVIAPNIDSYGLDLLFYKKQ